MNSIFERLEVWLKAVSFPIMSYRLIWSRHHSISLARLIALIKHPRAILLAQRSVLLEYEMNMHKSSKQQRRSVCLLQRSSSPPEYQMIAKVAQNRCRSARLRRGLVTHIREDRKQRNQFLVPKRRRRIFSWMASRHLSSWASLLSQTTRKISWHESAKGKALNPIDERRELQRNFAFVSCRRHLQNCSVSWNLLWR